MRTQVVKWGIVVVLAVLCAGCFRPASDTTPPTTSNTVSNTGSASNVVSPPPTIAQSTDQATATNGAPPVTVLSPNSQSAQTVVPTAPPITEITVIPFQDTATPTEAVGPSTPTLQIITPGISLDLITPDTPTPLPPEVTNSLLPGNPIDINGTESVGSTAEATAEGTELVSGAPCTYTIQAGDTLYKIANANETTVNALIDANPDIGGAGAILQIGQVLKLPDCIPGQSPTAVVTVVGESNSVPLPNQDTYTVQPGDTLGSIAAQYGVSVNAIMQANHLTNPNLLSLGQKLIIPIRNSTP
ncbi:MAG TPA: LysM peptidoglycan-binding domain-containing protein [Phototrophicaceae bacterium]|nr:LysM peptidoglycan-binding domain-containing protein [Phototrophicaceae bacterium]